MSVEFKWYGHRVMPKIIDTKSRALVSAAIHFQGQAKLLCPKITHNLERSISISPTMGDSIYVGTNVEYAPYVEYGHWLVNRKTKERIKFIPPSGFMRRTIHATWRAIDAIFQQYLRTAL